MVRWVLLNYCHFPIKILVRNAKNMQLCTSNDISTEKQRDHIILNDKLDKRLFQTKLFETSKLYLTIQVALFPFSLSLPALNLESHQLKKKPLKSLSFPSPKGGAKAKAFSSVFCQYWCRCQYQEENLTTAMLTEIICRNDSIQQE